jgi:hypothetical protein
LGDLFATGLLGDGVHSPALLNLLGSSSFQFVEDRVDRSARDNSANPVSWTAISALDKLKDSQRDADELQFISNLSANFLSLKKKTQHRRVV